MRMQIKLLVMMGLLLGLCGSAWARRCPQGMPNTPNCIPPDHPASPYANRTQPPVRRMVWADRWGAIATDALSGSLGAVTGMQSEREAKKAALVKCRTDGGSKCKVDRAYYNQCAAMIVGDQLYYTSQAPTVDEAELLGTQLCGEQDANCRIYYSACSMAERIQ